MFEINHLKKKRQKAKKNNFCLFFYLILSTIQLFFGKFIQMFYSPKIAIILHQNYTYIIDIQSIFIINAKNSKILYYYSISYLIIILIIKTQKQGSKT